MPFFSGKVNAPCLPGEVCGLMIESTRRQACRRPNAVVAETGANTTGVRVKLKEDQFATPRFMTPNLCCIQLLKDET